MSERLPTLRAGALQAHKRRADLTRWAATWTDQPGPYAAALCEGIAVAVAFMVSGRFGPAALCVHRRSGACATCDARAEGSELDELELEHARRRERLDELERWEGAYAASADEIAQGIAVGLHVARLYLDRGVLGYSAESPRAFVARNVFGEQARRAKGTG